MPNSSPTKDVINPGAEIRKSAEDPKFREGFALLAKHIGYKLDRGFIGIYRGYTWLYRGMWRLVKRLGCFHNKGGLRV